MSVREGDTLTPHRLGRSLLVVLRLIPACVVTFFLVVFLLYTWVGECGGSDVNDPPRPGSGQARMCNAWGGEIEVLYWIGPGLGLAIAVLVGFLWVRGRLHGAWVPIAVALLVSSPLLVAEYLTSPSGIKDQPVKYERSHDVAGRR